MHDTLQENREQILRIAGENGIQNVQVIAPITSLEETQKIILLVNFKEGRSLFDLIRFKQAIEDLLDVKVDVLTENSIHWSMKGEVLKRVIQL